MRIEPSVPTAECPNPDKYRAFDEMSAEVEVLEFWAQLVKTLKPRLIVETGTYRGLSAFYMGRALSENGFGKLITFEVEQSLHKTAGGLIVKGNLDKFVECRLQSSLQGSVEDSIDILLLDSEPTIRLQELDHFWESLSDNAIIMFHDVCTNEWHRPLRERVLALDQSGKLSVVMLSTPRGLAVCQKREGRR